MFVMMKEDGVALVFHHSCFMCIVNIHDQLSRVERVGVECAVTIVPEKIPVSFTTQGKLIKHMEDSNFSVSNEQHKKMIEVQIWVNYNSQRYLHERKNRP